MGRTYFVSGIDTGIGKTIVTGLLARFLLNKKVRAISVKMVQTGNEGFSEDLLVHRQMCENPSYPEDAQGLTAPQIFKFPSSPLLAAELEHRTVDIEKISRCVRICAENYEVVLVESAGGLAVPLTPSCLSLDLAVREGWSLLLVTSSRLGSINQTLLSLEVAHAHGLSLAGVLYNWSPHMDPQIDEDSFAYIKQTLAQSEPSVPLVRVPFVPAEGPYPTVDFSEIFV